MDNATAVAKHVIEDADQVIASADQSLDGSSTERVAAYARLHRVRRELEDATKAIAAASEKLEPLILEDMAMNGLRNMRVDVGGGESMTVMTIDQRFVTKKATRDGVTTDMICETLRQLGMGDMVSEGYSASRLKAKVLEMIDEGVEIPHQLARLINVTEVTKLTTRK